MCVRVQCVWVLCLYERFKSNVWNVWLKAAHLKIRKKGKNNLLNLYHFCIVFKAIIHPLIHVPNSFRIAWMLQLYSLCRWIGFFLLCFGHKLKMERLKHNLETTNEIQTWLGEFHWRETFVAFSTIRCCQWCRNFHHCLWHLPLHLLTQRIAMDTLNVNMRT